MIRVGIIGCGKVADKHVGQILRIRGCKIVGACDREEMMAEQLAERYSIEHHCTDVQELLKVARPEVIHITTPPQSHFALALECLEAGCHVYVEKPFTVNSGEAEELLGVAEKVRLKITVGHETQFMPVARDMRRLIQDGFLGGPPVHMESIYCYELGDERYAKALLGDRNHWVRRLPGGLVHNVISHGIGKIVEYLQDESVTVLASGFTSRFLEDIGETEILDEVRVLITDSRRTTAYFTFSSQISPGLHQFRVFGPKNSLIADYEHQTLIKVLQKSYKSYLNQFIPPFMDARQYVANGSRNILRFLRKDFHAEYGMHCLMSAFYRSVAENAPVPVPYSHILLTARIIDVVFSQLKCGLSTGVPIK